MYAVIIDILSAPMELGNNGIQELIEYPKKRPTKPNPKSAFLMRNPISDLRSVLEGAYLKA